MIQMLSDSTYEEIKRRIMKDLRVDVPNTRHFGKLVHAITPKERPVHKPMSKTVFRELTVRVEEDSITRDIATLFDYDFHGETRFKCPEITFPHEYNIGLIVGPSGSGKNNNYEAGGLCAGD